LGGKDARQTPASLLSPASAALVAPALAQVPQVQPRQVDPSRPDWENPAVVARNKLPASATHFPFESRAAALKGEMRASERYLSLDGAWHFAFSPSADTLPQGFERPDYDVSRWRTIPGSGRLAGARL
jgi:beta-galactosidase